MSDTDLDQNTERLKRKLHKEIKLFAKQKPELATVQVINSVLFGMIIENLLCSMPPEEVKTVLTSSIDGFLNKLSPAPIHN
jgi:hypothetical protein